MNEYLRDRILRKLDTLSDERLYQVLDFVEFLETKYAERPESAPGIFTRFAEAVEDRLRAGQVSASTVAETMGLLGKAMGVLEGVAAAGRSVASDVAAAGKSVAHDFVGNARQPGRPPGQAGGETPAAAAPSVTQPPTDAAPDAPTGATGAPNQPPGERRS